MVRIWEFGIDICEVGLHNEFLMDVTQANTLPEALCMLSFGNSLKMHWGGPTMDGVDGMNGVVCAVD